MISVFKLITNRYIGTPNIGDGIYPCEMGNFCFKKVCTHNKYYNNKPIGYVGAIHDDGFIEACLYYNVSCYTNTIGIITSDSQIRKIKEKYQPL